MLPSDVKYWAGLVAAMCTAVVGQAEVIPEPYRHWVTLIGILATVMAAYKITPNGSVKE